LDDSGKTITASDFRKSRQKALAEELVKPNIRHTEVPKENSYLWP
jgi:hypothetical protein